jgi:ABC-2 type transport system permease protein/lipopolysaccharide transport system permease protein
MIDPATIPERPPPETVWRRKFSVISDVRGLWRDRELIRTVTERDIRTRYAQSLLGIFWSLLGPLLTVFVFNIFFKRIGKLNTGSVPYPLQTMAGLLPWQFFTSSVGLSASTLIVNNSLINKMRCAREIFPISSILTSFVDLCFSSVPFLLMFVYYQFAPKPTSIWVLPIFLLELLFTVGFSLAMSTVTVYVRDVRVLLGGLLSVGLFLSPIAYPVSKIPANWRVPLTFLNPFIAFIDGFRRAILYNLPPQRELMIPATITTVVVCCVGYVVFRRTEIGIADVA